MLPPIHRPSNNGVSSQTASAMHAVPGSSAAGTTGPAIGSGSDTSSRSYRPPMLSKEAVGHPSADHCDDLPGASRLLLDKLCALERENESVRDELQHVRRRLFNNQQEREEERLSLSKVVEELQRLALAFNAKLQADATNQQREQQKAALLFAEVARLGQHVGKVDGALQVLAEDTRRKLMEHQQQQQNMTVASTSSLSPTVRHHDFRRQQQLMDDLQRDLQQLRLECEAERSNWRRRFDDHDVVVERSRQQLIADIQNRLAADKMEILTRLTDEWRQLVASTDAKRGVQISSELSRVNDHFADLERWLHSELSAAKRVIQVLVVEADGKLQALAQSVVSALSATASSVAVGDDELRVTLLGLQDAVGEVTHRVQKKLVTLEDALPLEVKARQQGDDKLRRRIDSVLKAAEMARTSTIEFGKQQKSIVASQIERKLDAVTRQMEALVGGSESKALAAIREWAERLKEEEKKEKSEQEERLRAVLEQKADREAVAALSAAQDGLREALTSIRVSQVVAPASSSRSQEREDHSTAIAAVEDKVQRLLGKLSDRHNDLLDLLQDLEQRQHEGGARVEALQTWTTTHASECRAVYDYVTWSLETSALDNQVCRVIGGLVDRIADADTSDRLERLERRVVSTPISSTRLIGGNSENSQSHAHRANDEQQRAGGDDDGNMDGDALNQESLPDGGYPKEEETPDPMDEDTKSDGADWGRGEEGGASLDDDDGKANDDALNHELLPDGEYLGGEEASDLMDEGTKSDSADFGRGEEREPVSYDGEGDHGGGNDDTDAGYDDFADAVGEYSDTDLLSPPSQSDASPLPIESDANFTGGTREGVGNGDGDGTDYNSVDVGGDVNDEDEQPSPRSDPARDKDTNHDAGASFDTATYATSATS